ncbi:MAG: MarR family transcriptional regulator [Lacrimispora sp.]
MEIEDLIQRFKDTREHQVKAIFSTLFIAENKLQTIFDKEDKDITLKQFMLLTMVRRSGDELTFTQSGRLLGCSRQNIKKLAASLEEKGFVEIKQSQKDIRAAAIVPTDKLTLYFDKISALHKQKLNILFEEYTDSEIQMLFDLLMKLYKGIECLENSNETINRK